MNQNIKKHIPNILTMSRILVIPMVIVLFFVQASWALWTILGLYIYASVTDFFDGYLARKFKVVSELGRFLDPIADKLLVTTLMVFLVAKGNIIGINVAAVALILLREIFVSGLREFMGPKKITIHVTKLAKWKTTVQMIAIGFIIINQYGAGIYIVGNILLWIATFMTVITGYNYFKAALKHMK